MIRRDELYRLIWEKPATEIAKDWGISGSMLTRICQKLNVPKPTVGHWAKVAHGKKYRKPRLPKLKDGGREEWQINRDGARQQRESAQREKEVPKIELSPEIEEILHGDLEEHLWVKNTRSSTRRDKYSKDGRLEQRHDRKHFAVTTSDEHLERALEFLNRLLHLAEQEGVKIGQKRKEEDTSKSWQSRRSSDPSKIGKLCWAEQQIGLRINEKFKRTEKEGDRFWNRYEYHPTGMLEFTLTNTCGGGVRCTWKDGKRQKIEDFFLQIIAAVKEAAVHKGDYLARRKIERERQRQIDAVMESVRGQMYREDYAFKEVEKEASQLAEAEKIRAYADSAERRFADQYGPEAVAPESDIGLWLQWIRIRADWIDPLLKGTQPWKKVVRDVIKLEKRESHW